MSKSEGTRSWVTLFLLLAVLFLARMGQASQEISVAVLTHRGIENATLMWQPTVDYLNEQIRAYHFTLKPLGLQALQQGVAQQNFDFVLTNPGQYVELEAYYGISRLATLRNMRQGHPYEVFGAVLFVRTDNQTITQLAEAKGKRFASIGKKAFGGFQMAWFTLQQQDIDPFSDFKELVFTGAPQDNVVYAVRDGRADIGTVRTDVMERMAADGLIQLEDFRIINAQQVAGFPFRLSTALYPEWAFSRTGRTPEGLAKQVAIALLSLPPDHNASKAGKNAGWETPKNYNPVHQMFRAIHYGPYQRFGEFGLHDIWVKYWPVMLLALLLLLCGIYHFIYTLKTNRRLMLAKAQAEAANVAKRRFLANMSHEIRAPLNVVLGYAQILQSAPDTPEKHHSSLHSIINAGSHLFALISNLIDIAKIETGTAKLQESEFSLFKLVDGLLGILDVRCQKKDLRLVGDIDIDHDNLVYGDAGKLRQVLYNLLDNAVKFTDQGEVTFHLTQKENKCYFEIKDTGEGISKNGLKTIFEPFQQGREGFKKGGSGLGLSTSQRHINLMGGKLQIISELGKGTKFFFTLTLAASHANEETATAPEHGTSYTLPQERHLTALIVDDVLDNRIVLSKILGNAGIEVREAKDGLEALQQIRDHNPDIIWVDIRMPVIDGLEATKQLRAKFGKAPICIALSASSVEANLQQYQDCGFDDYLPKPFRVDTLFALMEKHLDIHFLTQSKPTNPYADSAAKSLTIPEERYQQLTLAATKHMATTLRTEIAKMKTAGKDEQALASILEPLLQKYNMSGIMNVLDEAKHA